MVLLTENTIMLLKKAVTITKVNNVTINADINIIKADSVITKCINYWKI